MTESNPGKTTSRRGFIKIVGGTIAGVAAAGIGAYELNLLPFLPKVDIASTFNNELDSQYIKAGVNAVPATDANLNSVGDAISPSTKDWSSKMQSIFPALLLEEDQVKIDKDPWNVTYDNFGTVYDKAWYNLTIKRVGTQLSSGILDKEAKTIEVFKKPYFEHDGLSYFSGITIRVTRKDGTLYEVVLGTNNATYLKPLPILDDAPIIERETIQEGGGTVIRTKNVNAPGKIIDAKAPLIETATKNAVVEYGLASNSITTDRKLIIFDSIIFLTNTNNQMLYLTTP